MRTSATSSRAYSVGSLSAPSFAKRVIAWGRVHGRRDLPWQQEPSPYTVWISEIMLQQTRVETVVGYFRRFMAEFPDVSALAAASEDAVLAQWSGLGYYARARNLHRTARIVVHAHGGVFPDTLTELTNLPGIGRSTAGAILSLGHQQPAAILDGNVKRVLARHHSFDSDLSSAAAMRQLWAWSEEKITGLREVGAYTQHIMDLGALVCTPQAPACGDCPVATDCSARKTGSTHRIPVKRRRRELPLRSTQMVLTLDARDRIQLEKRPARGIWGGLWSLPESAPDASEPVREWPVVRHVFTHFQLDILPVRARLRGHGEDGGATRAWFTIGAALQLGLPAPVRRLIEILQQEMDSENDPHRTLQKTG